MTPIEFLARLRQLPVSTPLSLPHVAAALEMLSSVLGHQTNDDIAQHARWIDEVALAQWQGEPVGIVEGWRLAGTGTRRYGLGAILNWLDDRLIPIAASETETPSGQAHSAQAYWAEQIPALIVDDHLIGFFRSLNLEREPAGYQIFHIDPVDDADGIRAFDARDITKDAAFAFSDVCQAYGEFAVQVALQSGKAKQVYEKVQKTAMPVVLLRFFRCALLHDPELASQIAKSLDSALIRKGFHLAAWLWNLWLNAGLASLNGRQLGAISKVLDEHGVNVNQASCVRNANKRIVFQGTAAHLLADTEGSSFRLPALHKDDFIYEDLLLALLERKLNVDLFNANQQTGRSIAQTVENSPFLVVLGRLDFRSQLGSELRVKGGNFSGTSI